MRHVRNRLVSRRRLLHSLGAGAAALPFVPLLESGAAGPELPPQRFLVLFHPHGVYRSNWLPQGGETDFVLPRILEPLHKQLTAMGRQGQRLFSFSSSNGATHGNPVTRPSADSPTRGP